MKKITVTIMLASLVLFTTYAQPPQAFRYQAVVRDSYGEILQNQTVGIRISIHDANAGGTIVYQETFSENTNEFGLVDLKIGTGTPTIGLFTAIAWNSDLKFLEIEIDETGGTSYVSIGTSELLSVPYALHSNTSEDDGDWSFNGNKLYYNGGNVGIGTDNPEQYGNAGITLDVNGGIQSRYGIGVKRSDAWAGFNWSGNNWGTTWALGNRGDNNKSHILVDGNTLFTVTHEAKVGIGVDDPDMELCLDNDWGAARLSWRRAGSEIGRLDGDGSKGRLFLKDQGNIGVYLVAQGTSYFTGGNIGIGLTNPSTKLEVSGTVKATSFAGDGSGLTGISGDNLGNHQATQNLRMSNNWISGDGGNEGLYVTADGKTGAGTSSPEGRLSVTSPSGLIGNPNYTKGMVLKGGIFNFANIFEVQNVSANPMLAISNTGKLGIGADSPEASLHIAGNGWPYSFAHFQGNDGYDAGFRLYEGNEVKWHFYNNAAEDRLMVMNSDFSHAILVADQDYGHVGIGPVGYLGYRFQVEDNFDAIYAVSQYYNNNGWIGNQFAGVRGYSDGGTTGDAAVKGWADGNALAADFHGNVLISGSISKGSGSFLIDHPLDPENKLLRHNFMESPENLVVYRGKASLDANGETTVQLPDYFAALTKEDEATVILTSVGKPFLTGYEWMEGHRAFKIYGEPDREVSWMVNADRDDPVIRELARPVEEVKGGKNAFCEKGKLLYPQAYGYPESSLNSSEELMKMKEDLSR